MNAYLPNPTKRVSLADFRALLSAQRTIERVAQKYPNNDSVARRLHAITTLILNLPLNETMTDALGHPKCSVCQHPDRPDIEEMILRGESLRKTSACFPPLSHSSLYRHFYNRHRLKQVSGFDWSAWGY